MSLVFVCVKNNYLVCVWTHTHTHTSDIYFRADIYNIECDNSKQDTHSSECTGYPISYFTFSYNHKNNS